MIALERPAAGVLRIGHRGAAALAPENTLRSFRAAVEVGVDLIEFDVLDLPLGPLVLAHSDHLDEVSHGAASGRVRALSLEALREVAPELPTLDEALAFFVDEAPEVGLHVDLKLRTRLDELAAAIKRHGLERRTVVSGVHVPSLRAIGSARPARAGRDHLSGGPALDLAQALPVAHGLARACVDARLGADPPAPARPPCRRGRRDAAAPPRDGVCGGAGARRRAACPGLDRRRAGRPRPRRGGGRRRRDHERSPDLRGYTDAVKRGLTIAAFLACGAAGLLAAVLLAAAPSAGADDGTTTAPTTTAPTTTAPTTTTPTTTTTTTPTTTTAPLPPQPKLIAAGVTIGRTLVGGLTAAEAREVVKTRFARPLTLSGGPGARIVVTPKELGATPDVERAVALAARVRRPGYVVPLDVEVSRPKVERLVASLGKRFHREPVDATLKLRNLAPFATKDVPGRRLKEIVAARAIVLALKTQQRGPLELPFEKVDAAVQERRARPRDRDPARHEPALPLQGRHEAEADPRVQGGDGAFPVPDAARALRGRQQAAQPVVVPAGRLRLGEGRGADPARAREPARNALDGDLRTVRGHPRHA